MVPSQLCSHLGGEGDQPLWMRLHGRVEFESDHQRRHPELCREARWWLERQQQLVELEFMVAGSDELRRRYPGIDPEEIDLSREARSSSAVSSWANSMVLSFEPFSASTSS